MSIYSHNIKHLDYKSIKDQNNLLSESVDKSSLDANFKKKDKIKLSNLRMESRQRNDEGKSLVLSWYNDKEFVATVLVDTIPASDGYKWFGSFRVSKKYRGSGLGDQIMDLIISSKYKAGALSVYKDNEVAINLYKKHGFKISKERTNKDYYFMYLEKNRDKSAIIETNKFNNPNILSDWMKKHIKYKEFTKLMSAEEVATKKAGSCHDQAEFENYMFNIMNIKHGRIFFIEYNKDSNQGGMTHTFLWYKEKNKFYWFENAWGGQEGIHGPYNSIAEMKDKVKELHMKNSKFDDIEFANVKNIKPGMNLQEYVDACLA